MCIVYRINHHTTHNSGKTHNRTSARERSKPKRPPVRKESLQLKAISRHPKPPHIQNPLRLRGPECAQVFASAVRSLTVFVVVAVAVFPTNNPNRTSPDFNFRSLVHRSRTEHAQFVHESNGAVRPPSSAHDRARRSPSAPSCPPPQLVDAQQHDGGISGRRWRWSGQRQVQ